MPQTSAPVGRELLDEHAVARWLGCSRRHVAHLDATGQMPAPVRIGHLKRWSPDVIQRWIDAGCPPREQTGGEDAR